MHNYLIKANALPTGLGLLCIKIFDQLKASTSPNVTLICTALMVIKKIFLMNVIANLRFNVSTLQL